MIRDEKRRYNNLRILLVNSIIVAKYTAKINLVWHIAIQVSYLVDFSRIQEL